MLKQIDVQDLQPGMVIVRITLQNGPVKIKKSGLVTSQGMVQGLIEMGIQQLEIDPDQTVEVEAPKIKKSATRRMLESNKVTNTRIDDGLSEQFNRSLFLPSVQDIPSPWLFYAKRYLLVGLIALGGFGFGWTCASYQEILSLLNSQSNKPTVNISAPAPLIPETVQVKNDVKPLPEVGKSQNDMFDKVIETPVLPKETTNDVSTEISPSDSVQQSSETPDPVISADVLARFRKAMTEVEDLPVTTQPIDKLQSNGDVPRVDQLPAWVMNRLPSMAFSAHMYASIESDRWVRVNGTRMVEGDSIDNMVEIVRIEPQYVILNYSGQIFSMAALTDW